MKAQPIITIRSNKLIDGSDAQRGDLSHHGDVLVRGIYNGTSDVRRVKSLGDDTVIKMMDYAAQKGGYVVAWAPGLTTKVLSALPVGTDEMTDADAKAEAQRMEALENGAQYHEEKRMEAVAGAMERRRDARGRFVAA